MAAGKGIAAFVFVLNSVPPEMPPTGILTNLNVSAGESFRSLKPKSDTKKTRLANLIVLIVLSVPSGASGTEGDV